jgi:outer membrane protein TolC
MRPEAGPRASRLARTLVALAALLPLGCRSVRVEMPTIAPAWTASAAARPLSHADCVRLAERSAPTAAAWRARRLAAAAALSQARRLPNPGLAVAWEDFALPGGAPAAAAQATFSLSYALEQLLSRPRRVAAAAREREAEVADLLAERQHLAAEVAKAYDALVAARERETLSAELAVLAERQRDALARFAAAGERSGLEREQAEAEVLKSLGDRTKAQTAARARALELAFALGFERPTVLLLSEPLTPPAATAAQPAPEDLVAAVQRRPEVAAARARYEAERARLRLASDRVQFLPVLGVGVRRVDEESLGVASVDVVLPLFDGGGAAVCAQSAALLAAAAALRKAVARVVQEVYLTADRAAAARDYLASNARPLAASRRRLRERAETLFTGGEGAFDDALRARRDEVDARLDLLDAELEAAGAATDLEAALGRLAPDAGMP